MQYALLVWGLDAPECITVLFSLSFDQFNKHLIYFFVSE